MTVNRLSAQSAKVQLTSEELRIFLTGPDDDPGSPQMLRLISFLILKAESVTGIPFSALPVTVELLRAQDGGLAAYFTAEKPADPAADTPKTMRFAARFPDRKTLIRCCRILQKKQDALLTSRLYRYQAFLILELKSRHLHAGTLRHLLLEFGAPFRLSVMNRAVLSEYGECIYERDAVARILAEAV